MMEMKRCAEERQALLSSTQNPETHENDDEVILLRNLPFIHHQYQENEEHSRTAPLEAQEDFNFCSRLDESSEMRAADEIFFRGQILPLHNSISRSQSMDHYSPGESMLASSTNSHHHSSTKLAPRNQFHSHPSPSPRILRNRQQIMRNNKKSVSWNVFRGGLIAAPPEIALDDLKSRCSGKNKMRSEKKGVKAWDIVGGCKCSVDATEVAIIKRSASPTQEEDNSPAIKNSLNHRTSQWLKKLSVQGASAAER